MIFEEKYFKKMFFSHAQIEKYFNSANKDIIITKSSDIPDVKFQFAYNALIKLGIILLAENNYKVSSRAGHHLKIIEKMAEILKNKDILIYGNQMRKTRNTELYDGGILITNKQADEYSGFVNNLYNEIKKLIKTTGKLL